MAVKLYYQKLHYKLGVVIFSVSACGVSQYALDKVKNPAMNFLTNAGLDGAIAFHEIYLRIVQKLTHPSAKAPKNKTHDVSCNISGDCFNIRVKTEPTISAVRKVAGLLLSNFNIKGIYPVYSKKCKIIGIKPDKDTLNYYLNKIGKAYNSSVDIFIGAKMEKINEDFSAKHKTVSPPEFEYKPIVREHIEPMPDIRIKISKKSTSDAIKTWDKFGAGSVINGNDIYYYDNMEKIIDARENSYKSKFYDKHSAICTALLHGEFSAKDIYNAYS